MESKIVNLDSIVPPAHQPRSSAGDVSDLVTAITSTYAFNSAIAVKRRADDKLQIFCGERRYWAMKAAVESHPDLPPLVSVIIYERDELTPDLEWMLALDENRVRKPLMPVDEARAVVELKLRVDCMEMRRKLVGVEGWPDEELPQSLEAWQGEYDRLARLGETQGRPAASLLTATWGDLEQQLRLKERDRRRMQQLAAAPITTQDALRNSDLGERQQIAVTYAPPARQVELIEAARQMGRPDDVSVAAIYAAAHALGDDRLHDTPTAQVLDEAVRLYHLEPRQPPKELCAAIVNNLTRTAEEFGPETDPTDESESEDGDAEVSGETDDDERGLSPAAAQRYIDSELAALQAPNPRANGHETDPKPPAIDHPRRVPPSEQEKLDSVLDTMERAVDYLLAAHRRQEREQAIARLREMLRRLEAAP